MAAELKRGDIVYIDLDPIRGSETGKKRPCVVIQNDVGNKYSPTTIIAVVTSQKGLAKEYPTDVWINKGEGGLHFASIVLCDQIRTIDRRRIIKKIGRLDASLMKEINRAIKVSLDLSE